MSFGSMAIPFWLDMHAARIAWLLGSIGLVTGLHQPAPDGDNRLTPAGQTSTVNRTVTVSPASSP